MAIDKNTVRERIRWTLDLMYNQVRQTKGLRPDEVIAGYLDRIMEDLNEADVHEGMNLEDLADRHDEYKRRLGRLSPPPEGGYLLEVDENHLDTEFASMLARWHRRVGVPFENLELSKLVAGLPEFLRELTKRVRLTGRTSISSAHDALDIYADENSALRRNMMWLLGRVDASAEVRLELRNRIMSWGTENTVTGCSREELMIDDRRLAARLDAFITRVEAVIRKANTNLDRSEVVALDNDIDFLMPYTERKQIGPTVTDLIQEGRR